MEKSHTNSYFDIYSTINTQVQLYDFVNKIDSLLFKIYQNRTRPHDQIGTVFDRDITQKILIYAQSHNIDVENYILFQKLLLDLKEQALHLPNITLFLAFEPSDANLRQFSDFFIKELGRKFIFRIEVKKEIIGGVIIVYKGMYRDYSLKSKLKKIAQEVGNEVNIQQDQQANTANLTYYE